MLWLAIPTPPWPIWRRHSTTGTNGKTTVATLLYDMYRAMGYRAGLFSTVVYRIDNREVTSTHTTPDAIRLNAMLREMVDCGCDYCFMEVSSHSLVQQRVRGLKFRGAIFTNLTHDHLDYHGTFVEYIRAKKLIFDNPDKQAFALVNVDDRKGEVRVQNCRANIARYSLRSMADYRCKILEMLFDGMLLKVDSQEVWVNFLGRFNAYNLLAVYGAALLLGAKIEEVLQGMSTLRSVSGRFEPVRSERGGLAQGRCGNFHLRQPPHRESRNHPRPNHGGSRDGLSHPAYQRP